MGTSSLVALAGGLVNKQSLYIQVCVELLANRSNMFDTKPFKSEASNDIRSLSDHRFIISVLQAETFFGPPFSPPSPCSFQ